MARKRLEIVNGQGNGIVNNSENNVLMVLSRHSTSEINFKQILKVISFLKKVLTIMYC